MNLVSEITSWRPPGTLNKTTTTPLKSHTNLSKRIKNLLKKFSLSPHKHPALPKKTKENPTRCQRNPPERRPETSSRGSEVNFKRLESSSQNPKTTYISKPCVFKDTWQLRCFQWSSRWTGWPGMPPHLRTALSSGQQEESMVTPATWQWTKSEP